MIETQNWMNEALARLQKSFDARLKYFGLQGSYRRGEATENSDIDLVVVLDTVEPDDLDVYRGIVHALPEGHKACGFICGTAELVHWPRHELFPFKKDTADYYGRLEDLLPPISRQDIKEGVKISSSALLHFLTHSYLYAGEGERSAILEDACKSAWFIIRITEYLATGIYYGNKTELLAALHGADRDIIAAGLDFPAWLASHSERQVFAMLYDWCRAGLREGAE